MATFLAPFCQHSSLRLRQALGASGFVSYRHSFAAATMASFLDLPAEMFAIVGKQLQHEKRRRVADTLSTIGTRHVVELAPLL